MLDRNQKLEKVVLKLAKIVKAQDKKIKKLAQQLSAHDMFNAVMRESNSYLPIALSDNFAGKIDVKLEEENGQYKANVITLVKSQPDALKQKAVKDGLAQKLSKLNVVLESLTFAD